MLRCLAAQSSRLTPVSQVTLRTTLPYKATCRLSQHVLRRSMFSKAMEKRMNNILAQHASVSQKLGEGKLSSSEYATLGRELSATQPLVDLLEQKATKEEELVGLKDMIESLEGGGTLSDDDKEMLELAESDRDDLLPELDDIQKQIMELLIPRDEAADKDAILEIRAGTGGDEASMFALEAFRMYQKYASSRGWRFEVLTISGTDVAGCREASASVTGPGVFGALKRESGVHRVQRVPSNDVRIHTSAITVAVLPAAEEVDVELKNSDLKIEVYRSGGAGGQSVNTTESAVRITHLPTGLQAAIQDERSQHQNKAKALTILRARVYELERSRLDEERSAMRSEQVGSGDRSERVRTYNFPQDRVTDHRVNLTRHGVDDMMGGGDTLDDFVRALIQDERAQALEELRKGEEA